MDSKVLKEIGQASGCWMELLRGIRTSMGEITVQTRTCSIFSHDFTNASLTTRAYLPLILRPARIIGDFQHTHNQEL